jgi:hypothetical protein
MITMDFICGFPKSDDKYVLLVILDKFIKYCHLIPLSHPFKAMDVSQIFLDSIYKLYGLLKFVVTDRDPLFTITFWQELIKKLRITLNFSSSYHPQLDDQMERLN